MEKNELSRENNSSIPIFSHNFFVCVMHSLDNVRQKGRFWAWYWPPLDFAAHNGLGNAFSAAIPKKVFSFLPFFLSSFLFSDLVWPSWRPDPRDWMSHAPPPLQWELYKSPYSPSSWRRWTFSSPLTILPRRNSPFPASAWKFSPHPTRKWSVAWWFAPWPLNRHRCTSHQGPSSRPSPRSSRTKPSLFRSIFGSVGRWWSSCINGRRFWPGGRTARSRGF